MDCHEDYHHGEFSERYSNNCSSCHTTARWSPSLFTVALHNQTRYPLTGSHVAVECQMCHSKKNHPVGQFHSKSLECDACHTNIHGQTFTGVDYADGCRTCHTTDAWNLVRFDHGMTKFTLTGTHTMSACVECHKRVTANHAVSIPFKGLDPICEGCHKDVHAGQFATAGATDCRHCHSATRWKETTFDHQQQSSFSLTGAHKKLGCQECHHAEMREDVSVVRYKPLSGECESCHNGRTGT